MTYINDRGQEVFVVQGIGEPRCYIIAYRKHTGSIGSHKVRGTTTFPCREAAEDALKALAERKGWKEAYKDE